MKQKSEKEFKHVLNVQILRYFLWSLVCELQVRELKEKLLRGKAESNESMKEESPISEVRDRGASESNSNGVIKEESNVDSAFCVNDGSLPSSSSVFQYSDSKGSPDKMFQTQFIRMEEQNFFSINEFCFFSVDQSPTL